MNINGGFKIAGISAIMPTVIKNALAVDLKLNLIIKINYYKIALNGLFTVFYY